MKCPRTGLALKKVNVGKVSVFVSENCGGVFLENQTLILFECPEKDRGKALSKHLSQFHNETLNLSERITCPRCIDTIMLRRYYSPLHVVEIDECPGCGGIWLDTGELSKLQSLMLNEKEKALLRNKLLEEHRPPQIEGLPHLRDSWIKRNEKVNALIELTSYISTDW
ncbi:zf-TFIIB domain-containing protein [Ningiella sp. W23]|uniref:TFIIB-type zinc ribbon-containing protein n=1 Tax=Ningiella sp. W23 TaxID=3023715 RepID=UPI003756667F